MKQQPTKAHEAEKAPAARPAQPDSAHAAHCQTAQEHPARTLQRMAAIPRNDIRASDVLSLQRTVGNAAVGRMIAAKSATVAESKPAIHVEHSAPSSVIQLRGGKVAAKFANPDWTGLPVSRAHVMDGEVEDNDPKGLHAYTDGALPGITVLDTLGNTNSVHIIWWTKGTAVGARRAKWSSMFPTTMSEGMVAAVLQRAEATMGGFPKVVNTSLIGVPFGNITVGKAGATMFPVKGQSGATDAATVTKSQVVYTVTNHTG